MHSIVCFETKGRQFGPCRDIFVNPKNVILLPLHIKPGPMKNVEKGMNQEGRGFEYLAQIFPR